MKQAWHGFTLIELSILLVIIGLIVGGVLVGRDLINAAEVSKSVSLIGQFNTAVRTFQTKYDCLPGDCAKASDFGLDRLNIGGNGNGDGAVFGDAVCCGGAVLSEQYNAGLQLEAANLLPHPTNKWFWDAITTRIPLGADLIMGNIPNTAPDFTPTQKLGIYLATFGSFNQNICANPWYCQALTAADSFAIDTKLDDGLPATGKFFEYGEFTYINYGRPNGDGSAHYIGAGGPTAAFCLDNTVNTNSYNVKNTSDKVCLPFYQMF